MTETTHGTDLLAATRFVQAGRLSEATALLQRLLRGEPGQVAGETAAAPSSTKAGVLDLTPETLEVTAPRRDAPTRKAVATGMGHWPRRRDGAAGPGDHARGAARLPRALPGQRPRGRAGWADRAGDADTTRHPAGRRQVPRRILRQPGRQPCLQALRAQQLSRPDRCRWWSCCTAAPSRPTTSPPARA